MKQAGPEIFFLKKREKKQKKSNKREELTATEEKKKKKKKKTHDCDKTHIFSSLYISRFIPLFFAVGVVVCNNITEERERDFESFQRERRKRRGE